MGGPWGSPNAMGQNRPKMGQILKVGLFTDFITKNGCKCAKMSYFGHKKILAALMAMDLGPNGSQGSLEPYFGPKQNIRLFANS